MQQESADKKANDLQPDLSNEPLQHPPIINLNPLNQEGGNSAGIHPLPMFNVPEVAQE